jgi:hypothetical protein
MNDNIDVLTQCIVSDFGEIISEPNMHLADRRLLDVIKHHGLGVGLLALHQRGLATGHIPRANPTGPVLEQNTATDKFVWVHVPARAQRGDRAALVARGIINESPDPNRLIFHEDALVGIFSFNLPQIEDLYRDRRPQDVVSDLLTCLEAQDLLEQVDLNSRQVQFTDIRTAEKIRKDLARHASGRAFVRTDKSFDGGEIWLPDRYEHSQIRQILKNALEHKQPCRYCSIRELNPREDIASTRTIPDWEQRYGFAIRRSYELGFTPFPFGEPDLVCHFLAWDNPSIREIVNNMDLQAYSVGDLTRLTCAINMDIETYCAAIDTPFTPFVGVCNHWAGNSLFHQHFQFFRMPNLPLTCAAAQRDVAIHAATGLKVQRLSWPTPAYRIVMNDPVRADLLADLADAVAVLWNNLSNPKERIEICNKFVIDNHTQNTIVHQIGAAVEIYFIPRLRSKLDTLPRKGVKKTNLAVLEVTGYLFIDQPEHWKIIAGLSPDDRNQFGERALEDVAPDDARILEFEDQLQCRLGAQVHDLQVINHAEQAPPRQNG